MTERDARSGDADLVRMANQISANFSHHGTDHGAKEVAAHLRSFWTPTMRADLERLNDEDAGLEPLVVAALGVLRAEV